MQLAHFENSRGKGKEAFALSAFSASHQYEQLDKKIK
jgi:hypothetical protein